MYNLFSTLSINKVHREPVNKKPLRKEIDDGISDKSSLKRIQNSFSLISKL